jgi:hypothetical protein
MKLVVVLIWLFSPLYRNQLGTNLNSLEFHKFGKSNLQHSAYIEPTFQIFD